MEKLSPEQQEVILQTDGPVCVIARPGSGKTFTVVERIAHMIQEQKTPPEKILAITFTTKAASEMRERLLRKGLTPLPRVCTFHALAYEMLEEYGKWVGVPKNFKIATDENQEKRTKHSLTVNGKSHCSKSFLESNPNRTKDHSTPLALQEGFAAVRLSVYDSLTFDELLTKAHELLTSHENVLQKYQKQFSHIMVDEYQDTNTLQVELTKLIALPENNVCVIGDPDQSIYSFRGAVPQVFEEFRKTYPEAHFFTLTENYRSTPIIVHASRSLLSKQETNLTNIKKRIRVFQAGSAEEEARLILKEIQLLTGGFDMLQASGHETTENEDFGTFHCSDIVVLYRLHAVGEGIAKALEKKGIPSRIIGETNFFARPEIKKALEHIKNTKEQTSFLEAVRAVIVDLKEKFTDKTQSNIRRSLRLQELINYASLYDHLPFLKAQKTFLEEAILSNNLDERIPQTDCITCMTAHASKGLEFPIVFIVGIEEGLFPYLKKEEKEDRERLAEERRLLYVAMTRAKQRLYLSYATKRTLFGNTYSPPPSPFLKNIPEEYLERASMASKKPHPKSLQGKLL